MSTKRFSFLTPLMHNCPHYKSSTLNNVATNILPTKYNILRYSSSSKDENDANACGEYDRQMQLIKLEICLIHERGGNAPDVNSIQKHHWVELLRLKTTTARQHYYKYLFSKEQTKVKTGLTFMLPLPWYVFQLERTLRKGERKQQPVLRPPQDEQHITYGVGKTTFLLRIGKQTINAWRNNRLFRAMQYGEKLIFDCSYDEYMTVNEAKNTANQLTKSFSDNRKDKEPFDLHFCNVNFNGVTMQQLERSIPTMRDVKFPMNLHECSYVDLFPREELVYLTPHCDNDLTEYNPNMIYIIGALVDKGSQGPLSLGKAKAFNVKMARLPLDHYLSWGENFNKRLTLYQMVRIMLDLKNTGKWEVALKHVPEATLKVPAQ